MKNNAQIFGILLMIVLAASLAAAFEKPAAPASAPAAAGNPVAIGSQDVITASDSGGGYLSNRDILLVVLIVLAVFGLAAIL